MRDARQLLDETGEGTGNDVVGAGDGAGAGAGAGDGELLPLQNGAGQVFP